MMEDSQTNIDEAQVIAYLNGEELPAEVAQQVAAWLESGDNKREARAIYQAWELSVLVQESTASPDAAFERLKDQIGLDTSEEEGSAKVVPMFRWWHAAAAIAVLLVAIWVLQPVDDTIMWQSELATEEKVLDDQTTVTLNEQSSLAYSPDALLAADSREVKLTGEAFFEVTHDPERPFLVHTSDIEVKVLGTRFMVKTFEDKPSQVIVTEGKVQVTYLATGQVLILEAAEEVAPDAGEAPAVTSSDQNQLYWKTGILEFPENSLEEVLNTLTSEFGRTIEVDNEALLNCQISASFEKQSLPTIIEVITSTLNLQHEITDEKILIKGDGCQ